MIFLSRFVPYTASLKWVNEETSCRTSSANIDMDYLHKWRELGVVE